MVGLVCSPFVVQELGNFSSFASLVGITVLLDAIRHTSGRTTSVGVDHHPSEAASYY